MSFYAYYPPSSSGDNASVGTNGAAAPSSSTEIAGKTSGGLLIPVLVSNTGVVAVDISSGIANPLPVTDAAAEASLASIDSKMHALGQNTMANSMPVVIASNQTAVPVSAASLPLPSGAATQATLLAFSNKSAGSLVPEAFDYQAITYVGVTTDISTVVYKTGGSGGTTVATLTMGYDGSNRLTSVTRS